MKLSGHSPRNKLNTDPIPTPSTIGSHLDATGEMGTNTVPSKSSLGLADHLPQPQIFGGETDPVFRAWDKSTGIFISKSQIYPPLAVLISEITDGSQLLQLVDWDLDEVATDLIVKRLTVEKARFTASGGLTLTGALSATNVSGNNTGDQDISVFVPYTGSTSNVDLGDYTLTAPMITIEDLPSDPTDAVNKTYVDSIVISGSTWVQSVLDIVAVLPGGASLGDRYILSTDNHINEWNGASWTSTHPSIGTTLFILGDISAPVNNVGTYIWTGSAWNYIASSMQHVDTTGKQGGTTNEFYHLTLAQHTIATQAASGSLSGYLTTGNWTTFNSKWDGGNHPTTVAGYGITDTTVISGTPVNNQVAIWTTATTLEGDSKLTWDGSIFNTDGDILATSDIIAYETTSPTGNFWDNLPAASHNHDSHYGGIILGDSTTKFLREDGTWQLVTGTSGGMVYPGAGIALSNAGTSWGTSITDNSANWNAAYTDRMKWDGGATGLVASTGRTSLGLGTGATATIADYATLANPTFTGSITTPYEYVRSTTASHGYLELSPGDATHSGYVKWFKSTPTELAYLGYDNTNLTLQLNSTNFIINGGSVGIGIASPSSKLHVVTSTVDTWTGYFNNSAAAGDSFGLAIVAGGNSSDEALHIYDRTTTYHYLVVRGDGHVGIGTASPAHELDVTGTIVATGDIIAYH